MVEDVVKILCGVAGLEVARRLLTRSEPKATAASDPAVLDQVFTMQQGT
jgi:hypothetical protein